MTYYNYKHPTQEQLLEIFNLTPSQSNNARIRFINSKKDYYEKETDRLVAIKINTKQSQAWLPDMFLQQARQELQRFSRSYSFLQKRREYLSGADLSDGGDKAGATGSPRRQGLRMEPLNIEGAKEYPIDQILETHGVEVNKGKFALREERTPSCSIYQNNTRWHDHGSQEGGDSIDLYMKLNDCTFVQAVRALT